MKAALAAALLAAVVAAAVVHAQQPAPSPGPSFRVEVNYVELDASVTDAQGRLVTTLTADDFEVFEDGRPQKVTAFSLVNLPIERAERPLFAAQPIEADVQTNEQVEGRIYLIVLDDLHIDPARGLRVKTAVRRFIDQNFGTNDLAAVAYTSGRAGDTQDFTNNTRLLLRAVDRFTGRKLPSSTMEQLSSFTVGPNGVAPGADTFTEERPFRARNVMNTIRKLAEFMGGVRGRRKALVLVSEGVDYDIFAATGPEGSTASALLGDTHDAIAAATRGNVVIYGVDPRGLATGTEDLVAVSSTLPDAGLGPESIRGEQGRSQDSLRACGKHRRVCRREPQRCRYRVCASRDGEQQLLPARVLPVERPPQRPVPQDRGAREAPGTPGPGPQRILRAARPDAGPGRPYGVGGTRHRRRACQPDSDVARPGQGLRRTVQGRGAERLAGDHGRAGPDAAGLRRKGRDLQRAARGRVCGARHERQGLPRKHACSQSGDEAGHVRAREGARLPRALADESAPRPVSASRRRGERRREGGERPVRHRGP